MWVDCKCMEFIAVGWCTLKGSWFHQTIRNLTSGDLGIPLVMIRLGVTGLKNTRIVYLLDLFEGRIPLTNSFQQSLSTIPLINPSTDHTSTSFITALPQLPSPPSHLQQHPQISSKNSCNHLDHHHFHFRTSHVHHTTTIKKEELHKKVFPHHHTSGTPINIKHSPFQRHSTQTPQKVQPPIQTTPDQPNINSHLQLQIICHHIHHRRNKTTTPVEDMTSHQPKTHP